MASSLLDPTALTGKTCSICERPAIKAFRPFCSKRCADVDLGKWFQGSYSIPKPIDEDPDE